MEAAIAIATFTLFGSILAAALTYRLIKMHEPKSNLPLDKLIPPMTTIVVLDTSPARNLAYESECPSWATTFAEMARSNEYSFSLADNAFAELLTQIASEAISKEQAERILQRLRLFLNPNLPIFLGKRDIHALIGGNERPADWTVDQVRTLSNQAWNKLCEASSSNNPLSAEDELQDERETWFAIFDKLGSTAHTGQPLDEYDHPQLNAALTSSDHESPELVPQLSVRWDLQMRFFWRQYVRSKKALEPYDPTSKKKRNDGIDFDVFYYLMLPALVVATDKGFFEKIVDINSYQKYWFWKPEQLAEAYKIGKRPRPTWP